MRSASKPAIAASPQVLAYNVLPWGQTPEVNYLPRFGPQLISLEE